MEELPLPPFFLDLKTRAVDMACRLGNLTHFLEEAQTLQACMYLSPDHFRKTSRKIVSLIEIAGKTLRAAGISLYLFVTCPTPLAPFKAAYVELLKILHSRRYDIDLNLHDRVKILLSPLSSHFAIRKTGDPEPIKPSEYSRYLKYSRDIPHTANGASHSRLPHSSMPPPDSFPFRYHPTRPSPAKSRIICGRIWEPEEIPSLHRQRRTRISTDEQENSAPTPNLARPLPRRFGIFCTRKNSMHQPQERGRVRTLRPAKE